jgi:hypothetical protein
MKNRNQKLVLVVVIAVVSFLVVIIALLGLQSTGQQGASVVSAPSADAPADDLPIVGTPTLRPVNIDVRQGSTSVGIELSLAEYVQVVGSGTNEAVVTGSNYRLRFFMPPGLEDYLTYGELNLVSTNDNLGSIYSFNAQSSPTRYDYTNRVSDKFCQGYPGSDAQAPCGFGAIFSRDSEKGFVVANCQGSRETCDEIMAAVKFSF